MLIFDEEIGVDEAGRGPWAGPLVVAAVHLKKSIEDLNDSKVLKEKDRERLFPIIKENSTYSILFISPEEIDGSNILKATMDGMLQTSLDVLRSHSTKIVRVDGNKLPNGLPVGSEAVIKGDGKYQAIAAASILAKVARDHYMMELETKHPSYLFAKHKGYGTKAHVEALKKHGVIKGVHRLSYKPIKNML